MISAIQGSKTYIVMIATWVSIGLAVYNGGMDINTAVTAFIASLGLGTLRSAIKTENEK